MNKITYKYFKRSFNINQLLNSELPQNIKKLDTFITNEICYAFEENNQKLWNEGILTLRIKIDDSSFYQKYILIDIVRFSDNNLICINRNIYDYINFELSINIELDELRKILMLCLYKYGVEKILFN